MRSLRVVNAMFGAGLGGLEQVFVDYSEALALRGHALVNFVAPRAQSGPALRALGQRVVEIGNFNQWDPIAVMRLRRALAATQADAAIAHGNRAIHLMRRAARGVAPLIAVNHNVNVSSAVGADFVIAINEDMRTRLLLAGQPEARLAKLFNMVRRPSCPPHPAPRRNPPVIGAMGRFVEKKGFEVFLEGVARLKAQGRSLRAILAGAGPLEAKLKAHAAALGLSETVTFPGWVSDKAAFFADIDVFAFTSHHDVCPVVLLEAFLWAKPVVLADGPGPREISIDGEDSLLFSAGDAASLAERVGRFSRRPRLGAAPWRRGARQNLGASHFRACREATGGHRRPGLRRAKRRPHGALGSEASPHAIDRVRTSSKGGAVFTCDVFRCQARASTRG